MQEHFEWKTYEKDGDLWVRGQGIVKGDKIIDPELGEVAIIGEVVELHDDNTATIRL